MQSILTFYVFYCQILFLHYYLMYAPIRIKAYYIWQCELNYILLRLINKLILLSYANIENKLISLIYFMFLQTASLAVILDLNLDIVTDAILTCQYSVN